MSKESAKKLITELHTNEELKAKIAGITDVAELTKKAVEAGYDVTEAELVEADREFRTAQAERTDEKLAMDDLEAVAGGYLWKGEDAPDGHEMGCAASYHKRGYSEESHNWCSSHYYFSNGDWCNTNNLDYETWSKPKERDMCTSFGMYVTY